MSAARAKPTTERERVVARLGDFIASHHHTISSLEERMGRGRGYLGEALRGSKRLTVELILEVLAALEVPTEEFFAMPRPPRGWYSGGEIAEGAAELSTDALPAPVRDASLALKALVLELVDKGVLSIDELEARLGDLGGSGPLPESGRGTPRR